MKPEAENQDIALLIEQARRHRGPAATSSLAAGAVQGAGWILGKADALLHRLLMSPVTNPHILKEN